MKSYAIVDNKVVHIGDHVGFKSDIEQSGKIVSIQGKGKDAILELYSKDGFQGDYLRYDQYTEEPARECWL